MQKNGIIKNFSVNIDYKKIGFPTEVFVFIGFQANVEVSQRELAKK